MTAMYSQNRSSWILFLLSHAYNLIMIIVSAPGNIPTATSSEQQRSHNPVALGSETMSVTKNQTKTTVNVNQ
jgi:hypothetical protein